MNVYDLNPGMNSMLFGVGLGFYHTGIQIGAVEYTFGYHPGTHTGVV